MDLKETFIEKNTKRLLKQILKKQILKQTFGFKTLYYPPQIPELEPFGKDLCKLINLIRFRTNVNIFQKQLSRDIRKSENQRVC